MYLLESGSACPYIKEIKQWIEILSTSTRRYVIIDLKIPFSWKITNVPFPNCWSNDALDKNYFYLIINSSIQYNVETQKVLLY